MRANERFLEELQARVPKDALAMFLCRSGGRSHETAMLAKKTGYATTFNVARGLRG